MPRHVGLQGRLASRAHGRRAEISAPGVDFFVPMDAGAQIPAARRELGCLGHEADRGSASSAGAIPST
jgi:hypothetical protein